jgi:hypothetical protein
VDDILVPVSPGELIDKLTILRIKTENIGDAVKLANIRHEQAVLQDAADKAIPMTAEIDRLWQALYEINARLWVIEDDIRDCDSAGDFGETFIALARAVYQTNDERAKVKRQINDALGSAIVEEKSYHGHGGSGQ